MIFVRPFICVCLVGAISIQGFSQASFLDSISDPNYVAWEYELDEVLIEDANTDEYNATLRYYKSDPLNSTDEIMEKLVGIWAIKRGNYAYEPVMRGLSAGQINVTIDEMRVLGACTDKMDPITSYVEPNNLEKLNVSQGATGFQSGSTVGGSFDMQIKKPAFNSEKPWATSFGTRLLSANNGVESLFNTSYSKNKVGVRVGAAYRKGENYREGGGELIDHSAYNKVNYSASLSYLPGNNDLVNLSLIGDNAWDVGYPALPMDVGSADAKIIGLTYDKWFKNRSFYQWTAKVYYNQVNHVMDDSNREVIVKMDMPGYTKTFGSFIKGNYEWSDRLYGLMKLDFYKSFAHAEMTMYFPGSPPMFMLTWPDVKRNVLGYQNQTFYNINNRSTLNGGFRIESNMASIESTLGEQQVSVFQFDEPNPGEVLINANIGFDQKIGKLINVDVKLSYGQRMPNEGEQYGFYLFNAYDGYDYIGRPDLKSEQSVQFETSIKIEANKFRFNLTGYYYQFNRYIIGKIHDDLIPMTIGANGVKVYENLDFVELAGLESQFAFKWKHFDLLNSTKFTYGQMEGEMPLPLMPPLKNNFQLNYLIKDSWIFNVSLEASAKQKRVNTYFEENTTDGYAIANLKIAKSFHIQKIHFKTNIGIDNIFDKKYHEHLDWGDISRTGRNMSLSLVLNF